MARNKFHSRVAALPDPLTTPAPDELLDVLRRFALSNQRDQPQVLHPIREVAQHFRVPPSTIARIYRRLEEEGVLVSVRGSRTMVQGLTSARVLSRRGFVGLPAFLPWFVTLQDYRMFFLRVERELRARGFAVAIVFYEAAEQQQHDLLWSRIEKHEFDSVIWHQPDRAAKTVVGHLKDSGVRTLGVSDRGFPSVRCRYEVQRESAIAAIFRAWAHDDGITSVVVLRGRESSAAKEELLKHLLEEAGLAHRFEAAVAPHAGELLDPLGRSVTEAVVLPSSAAALCAFRAPEALARLMERARVALTGGQMCVPFAPVPDVTADVVVVDWQLAAEQITNDLVSGKAFDRRETTIFEAAPHLRAPLRAHGQSL